MPNSDPIWIEMDGPWWVVVTRSEWAVLAGWFVMASLACATLMQASGPTRIAPFGLAWLAFAADKAIVQLLYRTLVTKYADGATELGVPDREAITARERTFWMTVTRAHAAIWLLGLMVFIWRLVATGKDMV